MASQPRRSELLRATHAQHPARIATAAPAISSTAVSSRAAPASPTLESASDFAWRARPERVSTTSRRLAGEIHDDASSSGGRPSGPRVRPDAPVARIAASSGKRGHLAPATGDHFAGRPFRQAAMGPVTLPNVTDRSPAATATTNRPNTLRTVRRTAL